MSRRYPADNCGGTCSGIIDLSNSGPGRGGFDPGVPQFGTAWQVSAFLARGHTRDLDDPAEPIWVDLADIAVSDGVMEGRCTSCIARPVMARGRDGSILVLVHESGCPWLAALAQRAGVL